MTRTFARRLTGRGMGAVAVVEVSGEQAREIVGKLFRHKRSEEIKAGEILRGTIVSATGEQVDDGLLIGVGADRFELHVHGGVAVVEGVMAALVEAGAEVGQELEARRIAEEVEAELAKARTMTAARLLAGQSEAGLMRWVRKWREWSGELWVMQSSVQWLLERSRSLQWFLEKPRVAIVGTPNVGKSTLANALLGREAAITSDIAGTTRDWVDGEAIFIWGEVQVAVTLVDTAGVRETEDVLERESIERTRGQAAAADVVVVVLDGSREVTAEERNLMKEFAGRSVVVVNKMDVGGARAAENNAVRVSAKRGEGLGELMRTVMEALDVAVVGVEEVFVFTERQRGVMEKIGRAVTVEEAKGLLGVLMDG